MKRWFFSAVAALSASVAFAIGASQEWVKMYVDSVVAGGERIPVYHPYDTMTNIVSDAYSLEEDGISNVTVKLRMSVGTNVAFRVSNSTIANLADGTVYVWQDNQQAWCNVAMSNVFDRITQTEDRYNHADALGNNEIRTRYVYEAESAVTSNRYMSISANGVIWLYRIGRASEKCRLERTAVSDFKAEAARIPPVRVTFSNPFDGRSATLAARPVSNGSGGEPYCGEMTVYVDITIYGDGEPFTVTCPVPLSPPSTYKDCPATKTVTQHDGTTKTLTCLNSLYDTSGWSSLSNWGISFPYITPFTNADGVRITISERVFKRAFDSVIGDFIAHANDNHKHEFDEEDDTEEKHACCDEEYRGKDCTCSYVFKYGPRAGQTCGKSFGNHLEPDNVSDDGEGGRCYNKCGNPECRLHEEYVHSAVKYRVGPDGKSANHFCACAGSFTGGVNEPHYKQEVSREPKPDDPETYIVTYVCSGGPNACGYTWEEEESNPHEHIYVLVGDVETCAYLLPDGTRCNSTRPHSYSRETNGCKLYCRNILADGTVCNHSEHGNYWVKRDKDYHTCGCGLEYEAHHGRTTTEEYELDVGEYIEVWERTTIECEDPPDGCGETVVTERKKGSREKDVESPPHLCRLAGDAVEECPEKGHRGIDCNCDLHPSHFLGHLDQKYNGCYICANPKCVYNTVGQNWPSDESKHDLEWPNCRSLDQDFTDYAMPPSQHAWNGHKCGCGTITGKPHNFETVREWTDSDGAWIRQQCKNCHVSYTFRDIRTCKHSVTNGQGEVQMAWQNCECTICHTNRAHKFARIIKPADEYHCSRMGCANQNGTAQGCDGKFCSATTNTVLGTHNGWASLDDDFHLCECGTVTNRHTKVAAYVVGTARDGTVRELKCQRYEICSNGTVVCGWQSDVRHEIVGPKDFGCGYQCEECGLFVTRSYDAEGNVSWIPSSNVEHVYEDNHCECKCGMSVVHRNDNTVIINGVKFNDPNYPPPFCGCFCGTNQVPHLRPNDSCYCHGVDSQGRQHEKVLVEHLQPYGQREIGNDTRECDYCHGEITNKLMEVYCYRCEDIITTNRQQMAHVCAGDVVVNGGTKVTTYANPDDGSTKTEYGFFTAGDASTPVGTEHASAIAFYGATFKVPETATYAFKASCDDDASFTAGPAFGTASLGKPSPVVKVRLEAGVIYNLSWSVTSVGGPCFFSFDSFCQKVVEQPE